MTQPTLSDIAITSVLAWAKGVDAIVREDGIPLSELGRGLAASAGVAQPGAIRLGLVDDLPMPSDKLAQEAIRMGVLNHNTCALVLGYSVLVLRGHDSNPELLARLFRFVHHFELAGSLDHFLTMYLEKVTNRVRLRPTFH